MKLDPKNALPEKFFCNKCNCLQNYRTKHCDLCEACISKFDHHCFWIGGCVGELNHRTFWALLFFEFLNELYIFTVLFNGMDNYIVNDEKSGD